MNNLLNRALKQILLSLPDDWTEEETKLVEDLNKLIKFLDTL